MKCEKCGKGNMYVRDYHAVEYGYCSVLFCPNCNHEYNVYTVSESSYNKIRSSENVLKTVKNWLDEYNHGKKDAHEVGSA